MCDSTDIHTTTRCGKEGDAAWPANGKVFWTNQITVYRSDGVGSVGVGITIRLHIIISESIVWWS